MSFKGLFVLDGKYVIPKSGEFLAELSDIDFSYFYKQKLNLLSEEEKDEDMEDLLWTETNYKAVIEIAESFKDEIPNFYKCNLSLIDINVDSTNIIGEVWYMPYFIIVMDKDKNHYFINKEMELVPFKIDPEETLKFLQDNTPFNDKLEKYPNICNFNMNEYFDKETSDIIHQCNLFEINKRNNKIPGLVIKQIENSPLKDKIKEMDSIFVAYRPQSNYSWDLARLFLGYGTLDFDNLKMASTRYNQYLIGNQCFVIPLSYEKVYSTFSSPDIYKFCNNNLRKFSLNESIKENISIARDYITVFTDCLCKAFPTIFGNADTKEIINCLLVKNNKSLLKQYPHYYDDPYYRAVIFDSNFYTDSVIKPILLLFYKIMLKSNFHEIANKYIRIYYTETINTQHALYLLTEAFCSYFYKRKIEKGIDIHKQYKITFNNITKIAMLI